MRTSTCGCASPENTRSSVVPASLVRVHPQANGLTQDYAAKAAGAEAHLSKYRDFFESNSQLFSERLQKLGTDYCFAGDTTRGRQAFYRSIARRPLAHKSYACAALSLLGSSTVRRCYRFKDWWPQAGLFFTGGGAPPSPSARLVNFELRGTRRSANGAKAGRRELTFLHWRWGPPPPLARLTSSYGATAPKPWRRRAPPARTDADASPRIHMSSARHGRRRRHLRSDLHVLAQVWPQALGVSAGRWRSCATRPSRRPS